MKERYKIIPEVFLFLIKDQQVLLTRRFNTGYEDGNYNVPAGHGEEGETVLEGVIREAKEEVGLSLKKEEVRFVLTQHRLCTEQNPVHARVGFYFSPIAWESEPVNNESEKCDDVRWFPLDALPENMTPHVREALLAHLRGERYHEHGW